MKQLVFITSLLIFLVSCQQPGGKTNNQNATLKKSTLVCDTSYYAKYSDPAIRGKIEEAKWNLYLYAAIDTPRDTNGKLVFQDSKSYAAYPLVFDTIYQNADTLICYFNFYIGDSVLSEERIFALHLGDVPNAITVKGKQRCVYFKGKMGFDYSYMCAELDPRKVPKDRSKIDTNYLKATPGRLFLPTSHVVLEYINAHQAALNPWFINEAKKRGLIK